MLGQQLANGLTMGSIYALIAIGVSMIYKSLGMLNVAHGDTIMLSAFIALTLFDSKIPLFIVLPLSIVITGFFGLFLERFIYRRLQYDSFTNLLIATIGMSIVLRNSSILIWGAEPRLFPSVFSTTPIEIAGLKILPQNIGIIMISLLLVAVCAGAVSLY
jgi:branched-chain amino acid transport system permease protein